MIDLKNTTLAVLAGGKSSRMLRPKSELLIHGQPILNYLLAQWRWPGPTLLVTAPGREHPPSHELFTREVTDSVPDQGPLRGILTALEHCPTPAAAITTIDMPCVSLRELTWICNQLSVTDSLGVFCTRLRDGGREMEPFPSAFSISAKEAVVKHLGSGARSVQSLSTLAGFEPVSTPSDWPSDMWTNLNTPEDYERFIGRT
jgi:molybdopterin-guanine dinucleotide biosynthesis protein A